MLYEYQTDFGNQDITRVGTVVGYIDDLTKEIQCEFKASNDNPDDVCMGTFQEEYASCLTLSLFLDELSENKLWNKLKQTEMWSAQDSSDNEDVYEIHCQSDKTKWEETVRLLDKEVKEVSIYENISADYKMLLCTAAQVSQLDAQLKNLKKNIHDFHELQHYYQGQPDFVCDATDIKSWLNQLNVLINARKIVPDIELSNIMLYNKGHGNQQLVCNVLLSLSSCHLNIEEHLAFDAVTQCNSDLVVAQENDELLVLELFYWGKLSKLSSEIHFKFSKLKCVNTWLNSIREGEVKNYDPDSEVDEAIVMAVKVNSINEALPFIHFKLCKWF